MRLRSCLLVWIMLVGVAFSDDTPTTIIQEGNELFVQMKYEEAVAVYTQGIERFPDEPVLYYNRGNAYQKAGKLDEALGDYDQGIKLSPKKILLKNLYFNRGNVKYNRAENKRESAGDKIESLKQAISDYESAGDDYRKSLEMARDLYVARDMDLNKAGQYAKKNWALTREGWTEAWEQIKALERKNMKLEDGISQLLEKETDLLPHLENYFLNSMKDDMLRFNLKTLAQFHMDNRDDLMQMKTLAEKEIERANAELENYNASRKTNTPPSSPAPSGGPSIHPSGSEAEKLEASLKTAKQIEKAVNEAIGLSEWIIEGLNTGDAMKAWKHAGMMIALLQNLNGYLRQEDVVKNNYTYLLSQCRDVTRLLSLVGERKKRGDTDRVYQAFEQKTCQLSTEKMDDVVRRLLTINTQLADMIQTLTETDGQEETKATDAQNMMQDQSPETDFFKRFNRTSAISTLTHARDKNSAIIDGVKTLANQIAGQEAVEDDAVVSVAFDAKCAMTYYLNAGNPLPALMVTLVEASNIMAREIREAMDKGLSVDLGDRYRMEPADVMLFKYRLLVDRIGTDLPSSLVSNESKIINNLKALEDAVQSVKTASDKTIQDAHDAEGLFVAVNQLKKEILEGLQMVFPEVVIGYYYDKLATTLEKTVGLLPSTPATKAEIRRLNAPMADDLETLNGIMDGYFKNAAVQVESIEEKAARDQKKITLSRQQAALLGIEKSIDEGKAMDRAYQSDQFGAGDFLLKDINASLEKSRVIFSGKPDKAVDALEMAVHYQKLLKAQSLAAMDLKTAEETPAGLSGLLMTNQKDVQLFSGIATMKMREMIDMAQSSSPNDQNGVTPNQTMNVDPKKYEEAIDIVRDAMIEEEKIRAFLEAGEYNNTVEKHDTVVTLLEKALALLKNDDDQQNNQEKNNGHQDKEQGENQQKQSPNPQNNGQNKGGGQKQTKPLELTPQQARELLNELNKQDQDKHEEKQAVKQPVNVPRPW